MGDDGHGVEFRVLGTLEVVAGGDLVEVGGRQLRTVLALLVADAGRMVSVSRLADCLWGQDAPPDAHRTIRTYLSRLRKAFAATSAGPRAAEVIATRPPGYVLQVDPDAIDAVRFEQLARSGRQALQSTTPTVANELLVAALGLWRGTAYCEFGGTTALAAESNRLARLRQEAVLDRIDADLAIGLGSELVAELQELTTAAPEHERLWAQLMTALYRADRQSEALETFRTAQRLLAETSGVAPGPALTEIHRRILDQDQRLLDPRPARSADLAGVRRGQPEAAVTLPVQLPPAVPAFAGRRREIAQLDELCVPGANPVIVCALSGPAGVGKTALAVHWAWRVRAAFPDGQLYVNLRGFDPGGSSMSADEAVNGFLHALGVPPARIPSGLAAKTALYRSILAGRRVLVVLDNAYDAEQVRPLVPATPDSLVLVTSRNQLTSLAVTEGARLLTVEVLADAEAQDLLHGRLGDRVAAEPAAVAEIIARCAGLPLALALVAARAAAAPQLPLAGFAEELRASESRLDALDVGDPVIQLRAVFSWSYRALSEPAAALFRLLGLHPGPDIGLYAAAGLAGSPAGQVRLVLAELVRGHLLIERAPGRYAFHDLLRSYAIELADHHDSGEMRAAALHRVIEHYLHTARTADAILTPQPHPITLTAPPCGAAPESPGSHQQALAWFTAERAVLLAVLEHAAAAGFHSQAWQLATTLTTFLDRHGYWQELACAHQIALDAADRENARTGQANAHRGLGLAQDRLGDRDRAREHYLLALMLFAATGEHTGLARTHQHLARMLAAVGDYQRAGEHAHQSLHHYRVVGDQAGQSAALNHLGWMRAQLGDLRPALRHCRQALVLAREIGDLNGEAHIHDSLGYVHQRLGEPEQALDSYRRATELFRRTGDRHSEITGLVCLGDIHRAARDLDAAVDAWTRALAAADELGLADTDPARDTIRGRLDIVAA